MLILAALLVVVIVLSRVWTDLLWFQSLEASTVFTTRLWTKVALFVVFGAVMGLTVAGNMLLAYRMRPRVRTASPESSLLGRYRDMLDVRRPMMVLFPSILVGLLAGLSGAGMSDVFLAWWNRTPFGTTDPYFGLDVSFFVFALPWWQYVASQAMTVLVVAALAAAVVHFTMGALTPPFNLRSRSNAAGSNAQRHLSILMALSWWSSVCSRCWTATPSRCGQRPVHRNRTTPTTTSGSAPSWPWR